MLDGKILRGLTGTPMRRIALANSSFADAEPEPLTFANLTTKSLVASMGFMRQMLDAKRSPLPPAGEVAPTARVRVASEGTTRSGNPKRHPHPPSAPSPASGRREIHPGSCR